MSAFNEHSLHLAMRNQDHAAISYLYDNYAPAIFGEIMRIVKHRQIAEDLLQESFICIFNNSMHFDPEKGRLFTWMASIARNKCVDHFRSNSNKKKKLAIIYARIATIARPSHQEKIDCDIVHKKISRAYPEVARMYNLLYLHGYTYQETAEICNMPVGTVKTKMRRTLSDIRTAYN